MMTITSLYPLPNNSSVGGAALAERAGARSVASAGSQDFASVLAELTSQAASAIKAGEETAIKGIQGQAPVEDVAAALVKAQASLHMALAVRDKLISAHQALTRVAI
jgi:flagellar hook-basal body complex protein FliE